ncbi:hypothetical protein LIER_29230 [Lithospermum erythrorhizon]|uniref:Uncharacterized protein n=1 Tax=Lithospermum erythrorhizon TaxID=34254 RepID=A0AAV3RNK7_LITER
MIAVGKRPSTDNLGGPIDPSVRDTMDELKESTPIGGDVSRPTVIDTGNDHVMVENVTPRSKDTAMEDAEGMTLMDVSSVAGTDGLTAGSEDVTPSAVDTGADAADLPEERAKPTGGEGVTDTMNAEELEILEDAGQEKKKTKKRKPKSIADVGEPSKPKKKLSKEEHAAKRARRTERKAKKADEKVVEENVQDVVQGSDNENVAVVIIKRRKAKGKVKINENRSRVGNKRIPKNFASISTKNMVLNFEEEEAKWKFVASRTIAAKRMISENTKKNDDIMSILEDVGIMGTVEIVGPYYP